MDKDKFLKLAGLVGLAYFVTCGIGYANGMLSMAAGKYIGNHQLANLMFVLLGAVIVAPLVEESAKRFFMVRHNFCLQYGLIFGLMECYQYIERGVAFPARMGCVLLHLATCLIMMKFHKEGKTKYASWGGFAVAILIHAGWNISCFIFSK